MQVNKTKTRLKVCGITRLSDLQAAVAAGADALGWVFYPPSPRYQTPEQAAALVQALPPFVQSVGLFVNASLAEIQNVLAHVPLDLLQFHGDETPQQCAALAAAVGRPFMRACRVKADTNGVDLLEYEASYRQASPWFRALLLDTHVTGYGGSGKVFDWSIIPKELAPRVVLSGGLSAQNVGEALERVRPFALDVSSGVEAEDEHGQPLKGIKDPHKIWQFSQAVRDFDTKQDLFKPL